MIYCLLSVILSTAPVITDANITEITQEINSDKHIPDAAPTPIMPRLAVNTDSPLDMNWSGMLTLHGFGTTPAAEQIVVPWWHGQRRVIDNLDVRVRVVDVWF